MLETASPGQTLPRAYLRVAGATIARHQLGAARAMGCQHLVCLARDTSPELIALQRDAESTGMKFHIVPGARGLSALVTARDELLVLSDGLLADGTALSEVVAERQCVVVQPAEGAADSGFERIGPDNVSAGAILVSGQLVEKLHELSGDVDVASSLTRIALQNGVHRHELPGEYRTGVRWTLVRSESEAHAIEDRWLKNSLGVAQDRSPGHWLARTAALVLGSTLLHSGSALRVTAMAVSVCVIAAAAVQWIGISPLGFLLLGLAWLLAVMHGQLLGVGQRISGISRVRAAPPDWLSWLCDLVLVVLVVGEVPPASKEPLFTQAFGPLMLVVMLRLVAHSLPEIWRGWIRDRAVLCVVLAVAAGFQIIPAIVQGLALVLGCMGLASLGWRRS